jgi:hypothetical protein
MFYLNKKIGTVLNKISPKLKSFLLDATPQQVAMGVGLMVLTHYAQGDIINLVVNEAYAARHGLVNLPIVTTEFIGNNSATSATIQGYVIEDGGAEVTNRGIAWATTYNPTIENQTISSGEGLGAYPVNITDLSPGTTYYARAYATNSDWTAYGNCIKFNSATTGILDNNLLEQKFEIYPNPASNKATFRFEVEQSESLVLTIVNLNGQVVLQKELNNLPLGLNEVPVDTSGLENGLYSCTITNKKSKVKASRKLSIVH